MAGDPKVLKLHPAKVRRERSKLHFRHHCSKKERHEASPHKALAHKRPQWQLSGLMAGMQRLPWHRAIGRREKTPRSRRGVGVTQNKACGGVFACSEASHDDGRLRCHGTRRSAGGGSPQGVGEVPASRKSRACRGVFACSEASHDDGRLQRT